MRLAFVRPGQPAQAGLAGAILTRDLTVAGERWAKGRRLSAADLDQLAGGATGRGPWSPGELSGHPITVIILEGGDVHEDEAALRLGAAVGGEGVALRGPAESRVDLLATRDGVVAVRTALLGRLNRLDPISVFTVGDGRIVSEGALVASAKVGPHVVREAVVAKAEALARSAGGLVSVAPLARRRVGALVKESLTEPARRRFEASVRAKVEGLGSQLDRVVYVGDDLEAAVAELGRLTRGPGRVDVVLTAGAGSTDPADPFFVAVERLGGRIVSHGVPAHPGSMLWLARVARTTVLGMPTCGAYSKATAVDLLLPWLLSGMPASRRTVARLAHGGILTRDQRYRFPAYARELEAPEG